MLTPLTFIFCAAAVVRDRRDPADRRRPERRALSALSRAAALARGFLARVRVTRCRRRADRVRARRLDPLRVRRGEAQLIGGLRSADEVALRDVAAEPVQQLERRCVLDALGDDAQAERVREVDRRADQLQVTRALVLGQARDERAVELQLADRERAEVGERGEAGAEVVDRDDDAESRQLLDDRSATRSNSSMMLVSVISSTSARAGRSCSDRAAPARRAVKPASSRLLAEMLTETVTSLSARAPRRALRERLRRAPSASALASGRPPRPAAGTSAAGSARAAGARQRTSASTASDLAGPQVELRLVVQDELAVGDRATRSSSARRSGCRRRRGSARRSRTARR